MRNSDRKLPEGAKVLLSGVAFLLMFLLLSKVINIPYNKIYRTSNQYDMLFVGASQAVFDVIPEIMDEELDCDSYLLGAGRSTFYAREALIRSALKQKSIKTIVIDVAYDMFTTDTSDWPDKYEYPIIAKLQGLERKIPYGLKYLTASENEYDKAYQEYIKYGLTVWGKVFRGEADEYYRNKGYEPQLVNNMQFPLKNTEVYLEQEQLDDAYLPENLKKLEEILELCKENKIRTIIMVTPLSERMVWYYKGWDTAHDTLKEISARYDVECYDFNLYRDKKEYFSDETCFLDENHLSDEGAHIYSKMLAEVIRQKPENYEKTLDTYFYPTYADAKQHFLLNDYL